ncbi:MAG: TIGR02186 family protein [Rhodospirillales bacterium]|nr:TIGR02186 family protein [Rhodospirillales bacterium]MCB9995427.1 TIGR02186 family protein [Rhodospirillales bacterium]
MRLPVLMIGLFVLTLAALPALAQVNNGALTIDLAEKSVNITAGFTGANLSLFGTKEQAGDIAIVIKGPERRMVVRRKDQLAGIWMNRETVGFRNVPIYYDLALSQQASRIAPQETLRKYGIGLDALSFEPVGREDPAAIERFREALVRNRQIDGYFPLEPRNIVFLSDDFFRANFYMPANVPTGDYSIKTYLLRNGEVQSINETQLRVAQVGFNARLYRFAHLHAFAYGLAAVFLAMLAGGAAWMFLRRD